MVVHKKYSEEGYHVRRREKRRQQRVADPERFKAYNRSWRARNQDKAKALCRLYYEQHRAEILTDEGREKRKMSTREYRKRNPAKNKEYARQYKLRHPNAERDRRQATKQWVRDYKIAHGCVDCGYCNNPAALHFDHITGAKSFGIGTNMSLKRIKEEIQKCVVRCANCHSERTWPHLMPQAHTSPQTHQNEAPLDAPDSLSGANHLEPASGVPLPF